MIIQSREHNDNPKWEVYDLYTDVDGEFISGLVVPKDLNKDQLANELLTFMKKNINKLVEVNFK